MSSCPENRFKLADSQVFLDALLNAPRPGSDRILAFYDSRVNCICRDPRLLLIPLDDHMCHRGDALFESIAYRDRRIFALDAHLARMEDGATLLELVPPVPFADLRELIIEVARAGEQPHGDLRIFLGRGCGGFGIDPGEAPAQSLYIAALQAHPTDEAVYKKGLTAFASSIPPKQKYLAGIKNTNYLPNVLMAKEANRKNMDVAISFDADGNLVEAAIANIAIVDKNGCLRCPPMDSILPGTTLLAALEIASTRFETRIGPVSLDELMESREILLFTSASLCVAITAFNGRIVGNGKPGPAALWLKDALLNWMLEHGTQF